MAIWLGVWEGGEVEGWEGEVAVVGEVEEWAEEWVGSRGRDGGSDVWCCWWRVARVGRKVVLTGLMRVDWDW